MDHGGDHSAHGTHAAMPMEGSGMQSMGQPHQQQGHHDHGAMLQSMDHSSMMQMFFHTGFEQVVLLKQWSADSVLSMVSTCTFFFIMAIVYELLKAYRRVVALRIQFTHQSAIRLTNTAGTNGPAGYVGSADQESRSDSEDPTVSVHSPPNAGNGCMGQGGSSYGLSDTVTLEGVSYRQTPSRMGIKTGPGIGVGGSGLRLFSTWQEMFSCGHIRSALLYTLQVMFAYLLMLAFMLFNVWISCAILLGAAVGHFLLAQKTIALEDHANEDYCH